MPHVVIVSINEVISYQVVVQYVGHSRHWVNIIYYFIILGRYLRPSPNLNTAFYYLKIFFLCISLEKYANTSFMFQVSGYFQYLDPYSISFGFPSHWFFANSVIIMVSYLLNLPALPALMTTGDNHSCLCYGFICIFCHTSKGIIKMSTFLKVKGGHKVSGKLMDSQSIYLSNKLVSCFHSFLWSPYLYGPLIWCQLTRLILILRICFIFQDILSITFPGTFS